MSVMRVALKMAEEAMRFGEVPIGAVIVNPDTEEIVSQARNRTRELCDPTAHAEIIAIRDACAKLGSERLVGLDLYVTLEPCPLCASAIAMARISRLYYGVDDPKGGGVVHGAQIYVRQKNLSRPQIYDGICADEARQLLQKFFAGKR